MCVKNTNRIIEPTLGLGSRLVQYVFVIYAHTMSVCRYVCGPASCLHTRENSSVVMMMLTMTHVWRPLYYFQPMSFGKPIILDIKIVVRKKNFPIITPSDFFQLMGEATH